MGRAEAGIEFQEMSQLHMGTHLPISLYLLNHL